MIKKIRKIKYIKLIAIVLAVILVISVAAHMAGSGASAEASEVKEAAAEVGNVTKTISASGTLSDDAEINIKVPEGVVFSDVLVSEGDTVKKGEILAKVNRSSVAKVILTLEEEKDDIEDALSSLSSTSDSTSDDYLKKVIYDEEISDLESAISKLRDMLDTGVIKASKSGTVTGVNACEGESAGTASSVNSSGNSSSGNSSADGTSAKTVSATSVYNTISTTGYTNTAKTSGSAALLKAVAGEGIEAGTTDTESKTFTADAGSYALTSDATVQSEDEGVDESDKAITSDDLVTLLITESSAGNIPQQRVASTSKYDSRITWNTNSAFAAGKTYTAVIELTSKNGYSFSDSQNYNVLIDGGKLVSGTPKVTGGNASGNKLLIKVSFTVPEDNSKSGEGKKTSDKGNTSSGSSDQGSGTSNDSGNVSDNKSGSASSGSNSGIGSGSSGTSGSASGSASSGSTSSSDSVVESSLEMVTCFSMTSDSEMYVTVSVDESDINSVKRGQTASITMDAIEGETFDGEITKVSSASNSGSGGSVKYEVTITVDKTDEMKSGMTVSAVINIEEADDVIVIPSAAINEKHGETFVYTSRDGDELSGETAITTGLSNGSMVEVTSGLNEGDTVYYEVKTGSSNSSEKRTRGDRSSMSDMGGSGNMPQGGHGRNNSNGDN